MSFVGDFSTVGNCHDATRIDITVETMKNPTPQSTESTAGGPISSVRDQLQSWKEIATFIGRDERTAMRWAQAHGMPVRRTPGGKRRRVYASREAIAQWLSEKATSLPVAPTIDNPSIDSVQASPSPVNRKKHILLGALGCSVALLIALPTILKRTPTWNQPDLVTLLRDSMQVFGGDGRVLWTHQFGGPLDRTTISDTRLDASALITDLLGDGRSEVLVIASVRTGLNLQDSPRAEVDCFSEAGTLLWSYTPRETFRFGDREFSGSWQPYHILISRRGPPHSILVAFDHSPWTPSDGWKEWDVKPVAP
jgi:hypothetical protein